MTRPCNHVEIVPGCHFCHLYATDPDYRRHWGGVADAQRYLIEKSASARGACSHLGRRVRDEHGVVKQTVV